MTPATPDWYRAASSAASSSESLLAMLSVSLGRQPCRIAPPTPAISSTPSALTLRCRFIQRELIRLPGTTSPESHREAPEASPISRERTKKLVLQKAAGLVSTSRQAVGKVVVGKG